MPEPNEQERTEQLLLLAWLLRLFKRDVRVLAELLRGGEITAAEWHVRMQRLVKRLHATAAMEALDGELDDETAALVEDRVREQYEYLAGFLAAVQETEELTTAVDARAMLYAGAAWATYWLIRKEQRVEEGATEARLITMGDAKVCDICLGIEAVGWMPIGEMTAEKIHINCRCRWEFR